MALLLEAARAALADAGLAARDVDGIIAPGTTYAELHELARELGVRRQFFNAAGYSGGAAVASAPLLAALAIEAGLATAVLCVRGLAWGTERQGNVGQLHAEMPMKAAFEIPFGWYPQIVYFAGLARRHMELYGTRETQLGEIAVAFRRHAALSENALLRDKPLTLEQYLAEPYLAEPFRAADCCLVNDGAGAFVMTSVERARDLRQPPVAVLGVGAGVSEEGEYASLRTDYLATAAVHSAPPARPGVAGGPPVLGGLPRRRAPHPALPRLRALGLVSGLGLSRVRRRAARVDARQRARAALHVGEGAPRLPPGLQSPRTLRHRARRAGGGSTPPPRDLPARRAARAARCPSASTHPRAARPSRCSSTSTAAAG